MHLVNETIFWAIGDTHLSFAKPKDFTRFGDRWAGHIERLAQSWCDQVKPNDVVLLLGDTSWASSSSRVRADLTWLAQLPGRKVMVRGNHDRWWSNIKTVRRKLLPKGFSAIQGDSLVVDGVLLCGAQGHIAPQDPFYKPDPPANRYERELTTLKSALQAVGRVRQKGQPLIIMMHYPPFTSDGQPTEYSHLIEQHAPAICLYAHLHRPEEWAVAIQETRAGVSYRLLSADYLGMQLQRVFP
jgi:hypothetical protein